MNIYPAYRISGAFLDLGPASGWVFVKYLVRYRIPYPAPAGCLPGDILDIRSILNFSAPVLQRSGPGAGQVQALDDRYEFNILL